MASLIRKSKYHIRSLNRYLGREAASAQECQEQPEVHLEERMRTKLKVSFAEGEVMDEACTAEATT